jgi:hypothetical protein
MDRNEIPLDPRHLGVLSGVSKMILILWFVQRKNHAPILRQDWYYLQTNRNDHPLKPHHLGVPSSAFKTISKAMLCLAQAVHLY